MAEETSKKIDSLQLDLASNLNYFYFDPPILKSVPIKQENKMHKENFEKLNLTEKIYCYFSLRNSQRFVCVF